MSGSRLESRRAVAAGARRGRCGKTMAWCVALWRGAGAWRAGVSEGARRLARDVERKAVAEGPEAALRLLERLSARRPERRGRAARRLVKAARAAVGRGDFRRAQTLLDLLDGLARDGTLGAWHDVYDEFAEFVWWASSRGAPYARQAMDALASVRGSAGAALPFGDAQHALCLELGRALKDGQPAEAAPSAGAPAATAEAEAQGQAALTAAAAMRALVRVLDNAPVRSVREFLPPSCFRSGLPAALRACASDSATARAEGKAALRALARAAPEKRPADFVQPLMAALLARGALDSPPTPTPGEDSAAAAAAGLGELALEAVGAVSGPVVLFASLRALRAFFWTRQRRCAARKYCEGEDGAEGELRNVCARVGGALLAALRGLSCAPAPQAVDAALLQQAAMTIAVETQVATREAGPGGEALFGELLGEILPLARDLYAEPPCFSAEASVAATFRRLLPWLTGEEVMRAAHAHAGGAAVTTGPRLLSVAQRVAEAEFLGVDWSTTTSVTSTTQDSSVLCSSSSGTGKWLRSDDNLPRNGFHASVRVPPSPSSTGGGDAGSHLAAYKAPYASPAPSALPAPFEHAHESKQSTCGEEQQPQSEGETAARRRRNRRKARLLSLAVAAVSDTSSVSLSLPPDAPAGRRPVTDRVPLAVSTAKRKQKLDPFKIIPKATETVNKNGCLLALTNDPCSGCTAVLHEMQKLLSSKIKVHNGKYIWANIQQELIWAEISKRNAEFQINNNAKKMNIEHLLNSNADSSHSTAT